MWIDFPTLSFVIDKCKNDRYLTFGFNWDFVPKLTISYTKVLYSKLCTCVRLKQRKREMYGKNAPLIECKVNSVNQMTLRKRQKKFIWLEPVGVRFSLLVFFKITAYEVSIEHKVWKTVHVKPQKIRGKTKKHKRTIKHKKEQLKDYCTILKCKAFEYRNFFWWSEKEPIYCNEQRRTELW